MTDDTDTVVTASTRMRYRVGDGADTSTVVEATTAVLAGLTTAPGLGHGLAAPDTAPAVRRYAAPLIRPART